CSPTTARPAGSSWRRPPPPTAACRSAATGGPADPPPPPDGRSVEADDGEEAGDQAVDPERRQRAGREPPHQEPHRQVGGHGGAEAADEHLGADAVAQRAEEVGDLV